MPNPYVKYPIWTIPLSLPSYKGEISLEGQTSIHKGKPAWQALLTISILTLLWDTLLETWRSEHPYPNCQL